MGWNSVWVWTSSTTAKLISNNTEENPLGVPATTFQISMIGGLPMCGAVFGALILTKLCDIIGRKSAIIVMTMLLLISTVVLAYSETVKMYYLCRFVTGLGGGAVVPIVSIFLNEISEDHNRSKIGCLLGLSFPLGNLYGFVIGSLFRVRIFTLLCTVPMVLNLLACIVLIPETPIYLASKGKKISAIKSLEKLRNKSSSEIEKEYESIIYTIRESSAKNSLGFKILLSTRGLRKGLLIAIGITVVQMLSGAGAILAFAGPLFDAAGAKVSGNIVVNLIGCVKLLSVFLATIIIERIGKRPLLLISTFGLGVSLFVLGLFFFLKSVESPILQYILWLPVLAILISFLFYGVGIGAITQAIMSELFPSNVRAKAVSLATFVTYLLGVVTMMGLPIFMELLGKAWCLWGFSFFCLTGFIFIYMVVPETKGKSVLEVQEILSR